MKSYLSFAIWAVGLSATAVASGGAQAQSVIVNGSPVTGVNIAIITQTGGPNSAVVQQLNVGQIGAGAGGAGGSVTVVNSPVIGINFAAVTQTGGPSAAAVQQSNIGLIGIGGLGLIYW